MTARRIIFITVLGIALAVPAFATLDETQVSTPSAPPTQGEQVAATKPVETTVVTEPKGEKPEERHADASATTPMEAPVEAPAIPDPAPAEEGKTSVVMKVDCADGRQVTEKTECGPEGGTASIGMKTGGGTSKEIAVGGTGTTGSSSSSSSTEGLGPDTAASAEGDLQAGKGDNTLKVTAEIVKDDPKAAVKAKVGEGGTARGEAHTAKSHKRAVRTKTKSGSAETGTCDAACKAAKVVRQAPAPAPAPMAAPVVVQPPPPVQASCTVDPDVQRLLAFEGQTPRLVVRRGNWGGNFSCGVGVSTADSSTGTSVPNDTCASLNNSDLVDACYTGNGNQAIVCHLSEGFQATKIQDVRDIERMALNGDYHLQNADGNAGQLCGWKDHGQTTAEGCMPETTVVWYDTANPCLSAISWEATGNVASCDDNRCRHHPTLTEEGSFLDTRYAEFLGGWNVYPAEAVTKGPIGRCAEFRPPSGNRTASR